MFSWCHHCCGTPMPDWEVYKESQIDEPLLMHLHGLKELAEAGDTVKFREVPGTITIRRLHPAPPPTRQYESLNRLVGIVRV